MKLNNLIMMFKKNNIKRPAIPNKVVWDLSNEG